jgi:hypothetical protein
MNDLSLTTRTTAGAALSQAQHDANLTAIQTKVNALIAKLALLASDEGVLEPGLLKDADAFLDGVITLGKLAVLPEADRGKFLRGNKTTGAIEAASMFTARVADSTAQVVVGVENTQTVVTLSEITIAGVPAGNVLIWCSLMGKRNSGANGGTLSLKQGTTILDQIATHGLDGAGTSWFPFMLMGRIADFEGGDLVLTVEAETSEADANATYGQSDEERFGRRVQIFAGL